MGKDTSFDASDPKWAVDIETFKPDKESTYSYTIEEDGWMLAHNAIRGELAAYEDTLETVLQRLGEEAPSEWEIGCMKQFWACHEVHLHNHHHTEDDIFNPFLRTRFNYPEKLEADHVVLVQLMEKCAKLTEELSTENKAGVSNLLKAWKEYRATMEPHLREEEMIGIPLMHKYFSHAEVGAIIQKMLSRPDYPKEDLGAFIYHQGEETFRNKFMAQEGIPFFVWYIDFKAKYNYYLSQVIAPLDALKSGSPPPEPESSSTLGYLLGACAFFTVPLGVYLGTRSD